MHHPIARLRSMAVLLVAAALVGSSGCSSAPTAKVTADAMDVFGVETAKVKDSIDGALKALETLVGTQGADLKAPFEAYSASVAALEKQSDVVQRHAKDMQTKGDAFFKAWETDTTTAVTPERRAELTAAYGRIQDESVLAQEAFTPFLASLKDLQGYLNLDLSRTGVESAAKMVDKAKAAGADVKARIEAVITQVNAVRGMLTTKPAS